MNAYTHFEVSYADDAIRADVRPTGDSPSNRMVLFAYGLEEPWGAAHRREYTNADARALCDWLNQRVEYQTNLRFPSPASPLGPELDSEAASTASPPGVERGMPSASVRGADALVETEIVLTERELLEAELLTGQESY